LGNKELLQRPGSLAGADFVFQLIGKERIADLLVTHPIPHEPDRRKAGADGENEQGEDFQALHRFAVLEVCVIDEGVRRDAAFFADGGGLILGGWLAGIGVSRGVDPCAAGRARAAGSCV
jgi:hypothetical protein